MSKSYIGMRVHPKKRTNEDNLKHGWKKINDKHRIDKPTILCMGGNMTVNDATGNGIAKMVENMLGRDAEGVNILSMVYELHPNITSGRLSQEDADRMVVDFLMPLVVNEKYNKVSLKQACKNLRNITVFAFCYGVEALNKLNKSFENILQTLNYTPREISIMLKQITCISFAPIQHNKYNTNFYIKSFDDEKFGYGYIRHKYQSDFDNNLLYLGSGLIELNNKDLTLYTKNMSDSIDSVFEFDEKEHDLSLIGPSLDFPTIRAEVASKCAQIALINSVKNSKQNAECSKFIPLNLSQIQDECKQVITEADNSYKGRKELEKHKQNMETIRRRTGVIPFYLALDKLNIDEKDILSGKITLTSLGYRLEKNIDYSGTIYERIQKEGFASINRSACRQIMEKDKINTLEIFKDTGFILDNGALIQGDSKLCSLYIKIIKGEKLTNNVKYQVVNSNNQKYLLITDGYDSYPQEYSSMEELLEDWKFYDTCNLTIPLTKAQTIALTNICINFGISTQNVIHSINELNV